MERKQIEELVEYCKNNKCLRGIFWENVFAYYPRKDKDEVILTITEIDEDTKQVQEDSFLEFRVIAKDTETNPLQIKEYLSLVKNTFNKNDLVIWDTRYFQIDAMNWSRVWLNAKRRNEWIQSFIFKQ